MANQAGGSIVWKLDVDDTQFNAKLTKAKLHASRIGGDIDADVSKGTNAAGNSFWAMAGKATAALAAIGAAIGAVQIGRTLIDYASGLQSTRASFESMLGSAEAASKVLSDLNKFSFETAFSTEDINSASKALLGAGVPASKLLEYMQDIGDVAGATGADLGRLVLPLSQAFARGKLQGQDFLQILDSGAGKLGQTLREEVAARGLGDFQTAMEKGLVTSDILFATLSKAADQGGFAFEGAIKQANTFNGRVSNLQENLIDLGLKIIGVSKETGEVQEGGLFDRLSDGVLALSNFITSLGSRFNEFKTRYAPEIKLFGDAVAFAVNIISQAFKVLVDLIQTQVVPFIKENEAVFKALAIVIGVALLAALTAVIAVFLAVGIAIVGIIAVIRKVQQANQWLIDSAVSAATAIQNFFTGIGQAIANFYNQYLAPIINPIASIFNSIFQIIFTVLSTLFQIWVAIWQGIFNFLVNNILNPIRDFIGNIFQAIYNAIAGPIGTVVDFVRNKFNEVNGAITNPLNSALNAVRNFASGFANAGRDIIIGMLNAIANNGEAVVQKIKEICANALGAVKRFFGIQSPSKVMAGIGTDLMAGLSKGIVNATGTVIRAAQSASNSVLDGFGNDLAIGTPNIADSSYIGANRRTYVVNVTQNNSGIVAQSRSAWREINKDGLEAVNEELRAKGLPEIGGGMLSTGGSTV